MGLMSKVSKPGKQVGSAMHEKNQKKKDTSITFTIDNMALINKAPLSRPPPLREAWGLEDQTKALPSAEEQDHSVLTGQPAYNTYKQVHNTGTNARQKVAMMQELGLSREDIKPEGDYSDSDNDFPEEARTEETPYEPVFVEARVKVKRKTSARLKRAQSAQGLPVAKTPHTNEHSLKRAVSERGIPVSTERRVSSPEVIEEVTGSKSASHSTENMQLLRILVPGPRRASAPKLISSRPTPTLSSRPFISAIKTSKENISVDDLLSISSSQGSESLDLEQGEVTEEENDLLEVKRTPKAKRPPPMMMTRLAQDDPRRKFYRRIKWKKKPPPNYEQILPRTTNYSCHDKMLAAAGYDPHTMKPMRGATLKTKELKPKEDTKDPLAPTKKKPPKDSKSAERRKSLAVITEDPIDDDYGKNDSFIVNYKPILDFLKLVIKEPQDYLDLKKKLSGVSEDKWLAVTSGVFSKVQRKKDPGSLVVQAAYELGGKANHPLFTKYAKEERLKAAKSLTMSTKNNNQKKKGLSYIRDLMRSISQGRGLTESKDRTQGPVVDGLGQMEGRWVKAEVFSRALTTAQLIRARDAALRELGNETASIRRWWEVNIDCQYLRTRYPVEDTHTEYMEAYLNDQDTPIGLL